MRWTCVVTRSHYWILGKNVDLSGSPSGCARRTPLAVVTFKVLSVWWKTSASVSMLFQAVLPHLPLPLGGPPRDNPHGPLVGPPRRQSLNATSEPHPFQA